MRKTKAIALLALSLCSVHCFALPKVLIIQPSTDQNASPVFLGDALAQSLEGEGKLDPIVWNQTDPIFRDAVLDGRVKDTPNPTPEEVQLAAKALGCDYVIRLGVAIKGTQLTGDISMMKAAAVVWKDTQTMDPGRASANDLNNTVRSVARTWAIQISTGPLHDLKAEPKPPETPAPSQGQLPNAAPPTDPLPTPADSAKAVTEYQRLMTAKQIEQATTVLREAVDVSPLDPKLRVMLIKHLSQIGRSREAAEEARRAAILLPDDPDLRAIAAQAYIDSGQNNQAEDQLNEALARNPEDPVTRGMLADIALNGLKAQAAKDHLEVALKKAPSKDFAYRIALCDAILGDPAAVQTDVDHATSIAEWSQQEGSYKFCMKVLDQALDQGIGDLRSLYQRASVKPNDPDVKQATEQQLAILSARQTLLDGWTAPTIHRNSHGKRSLALKLLAQSLSELKAFLADGSQDTLTDANIDLGEAIKQISAAKNTLTVE